MNRLLRRLRRGVVVDFDAAVSAAPRVIGSAKLSGLDPEAHVREVLTRIADDSINQIEELPPWNLVPAFATAVKLHLRGQSSPGR